MRQSLSSPPTLKQEMVWPSSLVSSKLENIRRAVTAGAGEGGNNITDTTLLQSLSLFPPLHHQRLQDLKVVSLGGVNEKVKRSLIWTGEVWRK